MTADRFQRWNEWAPRFIADLVHDFGLTPEQAAGFVGNFAAESDYFRDIVEDGAIARGWAGGTGFAQWTGPRRRLFEAWLKKKGFKADSYEGNYSYLFRELKGIEKGANHAYVIPIVKAAASVRDAAYRVAKYFERPKVINLEPRAKRAQEALELYRKHPVPPTEWATDNKEVVVPASKADQKVVVSNEPAAIKATSSPVLVGSSIGGAAAVYALFQTYNPAIPLKDQIPTLGPLVIAAAGSGLAALKRYLSDAQPITWTQKEADRITATVNTNPPSSESEEVSAPSLPGLAAPLPLEQLSLQQLAHELPKVAELVIGVLVPQLGRITSVLGDVARGQPPVPPR